MITLPAHKSKRQGRDTFVAVDFNAAADFVRIRHENGNMLDMKKKVDRNMCRCVSAVIDGTRRNVQTDLGLSEGSYRQQKGEC